MNLFNLLKESAGRYPAHTAVVAGGRQTTYAALLEKIDQLAAALALFNVGPGDLIGIRLPNSIDYIAFTYAIWRTGATVVPIGQELKPVEVDAVCQQMRLKALITGSASEGKFPATGRFSDCPASSVNFTSGMTSNVAV